MEKARISRASIYRILKSMEIVKTSKLSAILTNLPFSPDLPNSTNSPAFQGAPLVSSFALASKLLAILTNLPFSPDSPNSLAC